MNKIVPFEDGHIDIDISSKGCWVNIKNSDDILDITYFRKSTDLAKRRIQSLIGALNKAYDLIDNYNKHE